MFNTHGRVHLLIDDIDLLAGIELEFQEHFTRLEKISRSIGI